VTPVYKLSASSVTGRTNYGSMLAGNPAFELTDFESIATETVGGGGAADVEFTSIPATFTHLQIRGIAQSGTVPRIYLRYNGDTGSNYTYHFLEGNGSSTVASAGANQTENWLFINGFIGANNISPFIVDILDYANTNKFKTIRSLHGGENNSDGNIALASGLWRDTSAINAIKLFASSGTFTQYTTFALYGIKGGIANGNYL
jgi:hypothetical protein